MIGIRQLRDVPQMVTTGTHRNRFLQDRSRKDTETPSDTKSSNEHEVPGEASTMQLMFKPVQPGQQLKEAEGQPWT